MTIEDVIKELRAECKPYAGVMPHPTFFSTIKRIEQGTAKRCTIRQFFSSMGYEGDFNEWEKKIVVKIPKRPLQYARIYQ